jgi:hypothetical protein
MTNRSVSEIQRLTDEFVEIVEAFLNGRTSVPGFGVDKGYKSAREALLGRIRGLERQLDFVGHDYNREGFRQYYETLVKGLK